MSLFPFANVKQCSTEIPAASQIIWWISQVKSKSFQDVFSLFQTWHRCEIPEDFSKCISYSGKRCFSFFQQSTQQEKVRWECAVTPSCLLQLFLSCCSDLRLSALWGRSSVLLSSLCTAQKDLSPRLGTKNRALHNESYYSGIKFNVWVWAEVWF